MFKCCIDCVAPKRHPGCHSTCEEYEKTKEMADRRNEKIRREKTKHAAINSCAIESKARAIRSKIHGNDANRRYLHER